MAKKKNHLCQNAKHRSGCIKFVKKYKSLTVHGKGRGDYLFLEILFPGFLV